MQESESTSAHVGKPVASRQWHGHLAREARPVHGLEARATTLFPT
jgi:hypothetical protein